MPKKKTRKSKKGNIFSRQATNGDFVVSEEQPEIPIQEEFYQMPTRFGNVPVDKEPLGWDAQRRFEKVYPHVSLPFQVIERVSFGHSDLEPNQLFFGDNLHIMRMLPSKSIDLIYIDPPFFSGRNYNILYGDRNELRSFTDIWEGGMPGYLIWLNARLYEMKRLLKDTGSIYVHLDWHASHYVKVEMDKIFGYGGEKNEPGFRNEVVWCYKSGGTSKKHFSRKHDALLFYTKSKTYTFNPQKEKSYMGLDYNTGNKNVVLYDDSDGLGKYTLVNQKDWWEVGMLATSAKERLGYPTQKPEALLERVIKASSNEGDAVADFFCGGGTTPAVAQKLGRRWIASDISRIAIALTADRIAGNIEQSIEEREEKQTQTTLGFTKIPDFTIEHWGIYEIQKLGKMKQAEFKKFVIQAYNGRPDTTLENIHGYKNNEPLYVGDPEPDDRITKEEVVKFAEAMLSKKGIHRGTMLGWAFAPAARIVAEKIAAREGISLDFVKLNLVPIDSLAFKNHITEKHPSYTDLLSFVLPPSIRFHWEKVEDLKYKFDVSESTSLNPNSKIINVQWDFDYRGRFTSTSGYSFLRGKKNESLLTAYFTFASPGKKRIACRVQDDAGGEATLIKEIVIE